MKLAEARANQDRKGGRPVVPRATRRLRSSAERPDVVSGVDRRVGLHAEIVRSGANRGEFPGQTPMWRRGDC